MGAFENAHFWDRLYIDLNCVRAEIVDHPVNYQWCGYAEAQAGNKKMRDGFALIYALKPENMTQEWNEIATMYREALYGARNKGQPSSKAELLRCRIRYFTKGAVLGSQAFVDEAFENHRWMFSARRVSGARKMRGADWGALYAARQVGV